MDRLKFILDLVDDPLYGDVKFDDEATEKGGAGSGYHNEPGAPHVGPQDGEWGGSEPRGEDEQAKPKPDPDPKAKPKTKPDKEGLDKFRAMDVPKRKEEFGKLSLEERDDLADARNSVPKNMKERFAEHGLPEEGKLTGDIENDIKNRLDESELMIPDQSRDKIESVTLELDAILERSGASPEERNKITMMAVDSLIVQDNESLRRQLGDHGIHHIQGNIDNAVEMLKQVPGSDSPKDYAQVYLSGIFHDSGYLTDPSRMFLDEDHERWSAEYFNYNVRDTVAEAFDSRFAERVSQTILNHSSTDVNWKGDPVGTSFRMADNMALFQNEKAPPIFRYFPGNFDILEKIALGQTSLSDGKRMMIDNIKSSDFSPMLKKSFIMGVSEVSSFTPKAILGMKGGNVDSYEWDGDHLVINLHLNSESERLMKILDLGQSQIKKLGKTYGFDPRDLVTKKRYSVMSGDQVLFETRLVGQLKEFIAEKLKWRKQS